jgi:small subunit ribosomal protein S8
MTDPIGDMLTRIRNAYLVRKERVDISPISKVKVAIAESLKKEGFIKEWRKIDTLPFPILRLYLIYSPDGRPILSGIKRISKPGCRRYASWRELAGIRKGMGELILSTSSGIISSREAIKKKKGGEVICHVY